MARVRKRSSKDLLLAVLAIVIILTVFSAVTELFSEKSKQVSSFSFSLGKINADGTVSESETSVCSDFISCEGLKITVDPDKKADYWIFYYDENKAYIGCTGKLTENYGKFGFEEAKYARIFIVPELKEGEEKIRSWEVFAYANILTVTVDK